MCQLVWKQARLRDHKYCCVALPSIAVICPQMIIDLSLVEMSSFCPVPQEAEKLSATPVCRACQSLRARQSHLLVVLLLELFVPKGCKRRNCTSCIIFSSKARFLNRKPCDLACGHRSQPCEREDNSKPGQLRRDSGRSSAVRTFARLPTGRKGSARLEGCPEFYLREDLGSD